MNAIKAPGRLIEVKTSWRNTLARILAVLTGAAILLILIPTAALAACGEISYEQTPDASSTGDCTGSIATAGAAGLAAIAASAVATAAITRFLSGTMSATEFNAVINAITAGALEEIISDIAANLWVPGKTSGVLLINVKLYPLRSVKSPLPHYAASGHVEGLAALIMRELGVTHARLIIDNPDGICNHCVTQVPTLLPEGASLEVTAPLGTVPKTRYWFNSRTFNGNAVDPKPWPK